MPEPLKIYVGFDSREAIVSDVAAHSIKRHTHSDTTIQYLRHRDLRKRGLFKREWIIDGVSGEMIDTRDGKKFSTEFSHTRFLIPQLMNFKGWALFMDADMVFTTDIVKLFKLCDDKYAVMCVKHHHQPHANTIKMDNRLQQAYPRKNWSSFVMWNCGHPANKNIDSVMVNTAPGGWMHAFQWLKDDLIGGLPHSYNYISGVSAPMGMRTGNDGKLRPITPDVIHYTEGGPWFAECQNIPLGDVWEQEHQHWRDNGELCMEDKI